MKRILYILWIMVLALVLTPVVSYSLHDTAMAVSAADNKKDSKKKTSNNNKKKTTANNKKKTSANKKKSSNNNKQKTSTSKKKTTSTPKSNEKTTAPQKSTANKKTTASNKKDVVIPSAEQQASAFAKKVAQVEAENRRIAAYMTRDIEHRLGLWLLAGYSQLSPSGFTKSNDGSVGFSPKVIGGAGGGIGLGYQMRYQRFLLSTGAEFEYLTSQNMLDVLSRSFNVQQYSTMLYNYQYSKMSDLWQAGYVNIPLMAGMELSHWYWQAGAKVGLNMLGSSSLKSSLTTTLKDAELMDPVYGVLSHSLVSDYAVAQNSTLKFGLNTALAAEIGLNLDPWTLNPKAKKTKNNTKTTQNTKKKNSGTMHYRVAVYAEYGLLNTMDKANIPANAYDLPADFRPVLNGAASTPESLYQNVKYNSMLATSSAENVKVNPFLVGVKLAMYYELPRKQLKPIPLPKEPQPRLITTVWNTQTNQPVNGAKITIIPQNGGKVMGKTTNSQGEVLLRMPKGQYRIVADKFGFMPGDTITYSHRYDLRDTLKLGLMPEPKPIVYTLAGYVYDSETRRTLEAEVVLANAAGECYRGNANDEGLFVTELLSGSYHANLNMVGYMPLEQDVFFTQDTLRFYMNRIKEGVRVKINNLFFATNKTYILPESEVALNDLAAFLLENNKVNIRITGHTDAVGSDEANMILSIGRAKAVRNALIERGVDAARLEYEGKGETEPVATNDTEEGRALNRRVEFVITATAGEDIKQVY